MREIKFRGKSKKDSQWIYGSLVKLDISENNKHLLGDCRCYIKDNDDKTGNRLVSNNYTDWRCYDVDPETVGQFTGLHDKNGKEIYGGDIVKNIAGLVGVVEFLNFAWIMRWTFGGSYPLGQEVDVIGNIYENSNFLK